MKKHRHYHYPPAKQSAALIINIAPKDVAMFRFLLEAQENLAYFTVLEKKTALLKLVYSPPQLQQLQKVLEDIKIVIPISWRSWPFSPNSSKH